MTLLSLAVGILWADSYRERGEPRLSGRKILYLEKLFGRNPHLDFATLNSGIDRKWKIGRRLVIRIRTIQGHFGICISKLGETDSSIDETTRPIRPIDASWFGFEYMQSSAGVVMAPIRDENRVFIPIDCMRHVTTPFWAIMLLIAAYPAIYFFRGPRRRRKRRRCGQCLDCGYDMRGSTDQCPECGTASIPPTSCG